MSENNSQSNGALSSARAAEAYARTWNNLDVSYIKPFLDDGVHFASQNVFDEMTSKSEVLEYLAAKMSTNRNSPKAQVFAELGETIQYPMYRVREQPCVILAQGTKDNVLAVVLFETKGTKITRVDICSVVPVPHTAKRSGKYPR